MTNSTAPRYTSWPAEQDQAWNGFRAAVQNGADPDRAAIFAGLSVIPAGSTGELWDDIPAAPKVDFEW